MLSFRIVLLAISSLAAGAIRPRLDGRIVGGHEVDIRKFPYQLSLRFGPSHRCGASIISANWALTAAQCVYGIQHIPSIISFHAGSTDMLYGTLHNASKIVVHSQYNSDRDYDYALVQVETPFELGKPGVQAIKLASSEPADNTLLTVSGWGLTGNGGVYPFKLRAVNVHTINRNTCDEHYRINVTQRMICAADYGKDSCNGDSGGPLIDPATKVLVGIVSGFDSGCADPKHPRIYANVAAQRDWIKEVSGV